MRYCLVLAPCYFCFINNYLRPEIIDSNQSQELDNLINQVELINSGLTQSQQLVAKLNKPIFTIKSEEIESLKFSEVQIRTIQDLAEKTSESYYTHYLQKLNSINRVLQDFRDDLNQFGGAEDRIHFEK